MDTMDRMIAEMKRICARLPGVTTERDGFNHLAFKVGKKSLALLGDHEGVPSLGIKTDVETQAALVKRGRFVKTPYVGQHGWVSIADAESVDWETVEELIVDTYRVVAPKKLVRQLDDA
jgi:predicted DNA-binding protein (MmcQ/YjbR family)